MTSESKNRYRGDPYAPASLRPPLNKRNLRLLDQSNKIVKNNMSGIATSMSQRKGVHGNNEDLDDPQILVRDNYHGQ